MYWRNISGSTESEFTDNICVDRSVSRFLSFSAFHEHITECYDKIKALPLVSLSNDTDRDGKAKLRVVPAGARVSFLLTRGGACASRLGGRLDSCSARPDARWRVQDSNPRRRGPRDSSTAGLLGIDNWFTARTRWAVCGRRGTSQNRWQVVIPAMPFLFFCCRITSLNR